MSTGIGLEPGQTLDRGWEEAALALPDPERERLLVRADVLREYDDAGADAAYACYRIFRDELRDPSRVAWLLRNLRGAEPSLEDLARRSAESTPGTDVWFFGQLRMGQYERQAGQLVEATARLIELYRTTADAEPLYPGRAGSALALLLLQQGRALEARFVGARAVTYLEQTSDTVGLARTLQTLANVHVGFRERDHYDACRARIDGLMQLLPESRRRYIAGQDVILRMSAAAERGEFEEALGLVLDLEAAMPQHSAVLRCQRAYLLVRLGRAAEARELYEGILANGGVPPGLELRLPSTCVTCAVALDPPEEARTKLGRYLDLFEKEPRDPPGSRLEFLQGLLDVLAGHHEFREACTRAYDLAAHAMLERMAEIDAFMREQSPIIELTFEERADLGLLQHTFIRDHEELRQAIVRNLEAAWSRGEAVPGEWYDPDGILTLCAWCNRVSRPGGAWSPFGGLLPEDAGLQLSHGMCPDCRDDLALA